MVYSALAEYPQDLIEHGSHDHGLPAGLNHKEIHRRLASTAYQALSGGGGARPG